MNPLPERLVLLGHPLGHSLSPALQNAALRAAGIPLTYEPVDVPRSVLDDTLADLRRKRAAGNVTIPHKEAVRAACDRLTDTARAVGAVNTFWTAVDGALVGDNTDVGGFAAYAGQDPGAWALSHGMQDAWLAFARTGDPSSVALGVWPTYHRPDWSTMILGSRCGLIDAPLEDELHFWVQYTDDAIVARM